ncbi:phospholipid:diacylglycerol acyltransferase [Zalerion maritima]|uniref:Phospholipid:diacylglycerol acyltransferase n=1 Tax=Zalerion maritima TaxID=339359 RepID=A0AAD5RK46_9PEZI|nr:phospholipid:diacylglycerol acyltransferase [Zalerion maritima]
MAASKLRRRGEADPAAAPPAPPSSSSTSFLAVPNSEQPSETETTSVAPSTPELEDGASTSIAGEGKAGHDPDVQEDVKVIHHHHHSKAKTRKRRNSFIFLLGILFGIIAAGFFAKTNDLIDFPEIGELSMDSLLDVLPAGLVSDMRDLVKGERDFVESYDSFSVGMKVKSEGLRAHHPVILIPGVISTGLESWGTGNFSRQYFRKRLWGSWSMMRALVLDKENWKNHIMLEKETGLDPPNDIKLRAAQGFDATDFFITGYWIWNKILENMASIGYDPTNSFTAAYDWRLSFANLEVRDQYFTRLKSYIEMAHLVSNKKVTLTSHSMGSPVLFYFFHWVASPMGGNGGDDWVDEHVDSWINISGCMLGAVKDITAVLSGEMRDTAQLNEFAVYGLEKFLSKEERAEMFRRMPGISSMLPIGGEAVWGNMTWAPDDLPGQNFSYGAFLNFRPGEDSNYTAPANNMTVSGAMKYLLNSTEGWYRNMVKRSYSQGIAKTQKEIEENENDASKWSNPLETRLPLAPNLKIYCFYGVGKPTERGYYYRAPDQPGLTNLSITIDTAHTAENVDHGVMMGEGDGTVNLISTGYMCNKGWNIKRYNPAGVQVKVIEMPHEPDKFDLRGGPNTADHVDILGRQNLNELILRVAAGRGDDLQNYIVSSIKEYSEKVKVYEEG